MHHGRIIEKTSISTLKHHSTNIHSSSIAIQPTSPPPFSLFSLPTAKGGTFLNRIPADLLPFYKQLVPYYPYYSDYVPEDMVHVYRLALFGNRELCLSMCNSADCIGRHNAIIITKLRHYGNEQFCYHIVIWLQLATNS